MSVERAERLIREAVMYANIVPSTDGHTARAVARVMNGTNVRILREWAEWKAMVLNELHDELPGYLGRSVVHEYGEALEKLADTVTSNPTSTTEAE